MTWTKEQLIDRANLWAAQRGYEAVKKDTFLQWRKDGLLLAPKPRGRGRGPGKAQDWSSLSYLHLLKVMRLRHQGIIHRRQQRILLWLAGQKIEKEMIREDLSDRYTANMKQISRFIGMNRLTPEREAKGAVPNKVALLGKEFYDDIQAFASSHELSGPMKLLEPYASNVMDKLSDFAVVFFASMLSPEYAPFDALVQHVAGLLSQLEGISEDSISQDLKAGRGMLANPDEQDSNVLKALETFPMEAIEGTRNFINFIPSFYSNLLLTISLLIEQGEFGTSRFPMISDVLANVLRQAASKPFTLSNEMKVNALYVLLHISQSYERPNMFKTFADIRIDALVRWALENLPVLMEHGGNVQFIEELIEASNLPEPAINFIKKCLRTEKAVAIGLKSPPVMG